MNRLLLLLLISLISGLPIFGSSVPVAVSNMTGNNSSVIPNTYSFNSSFDAIPNPPQNLTVLETDFDYIYIIWEDNSDNETAFIIERHSEESDFVNYDTVSANITYYLDYHVEPYTYYYYRIKAINEDGESASSNEAAAQTKSLPHSPPRKPANMQGVFDGTSNVELTWDDKSDNEDAFYIYKGETPSTLAFLDSVGADTTVYNDYMIESGHTYYYYLAASNAFGVSESTDTVKIITNDMPELEVPDLSVLRTSHNSIHLVWDSIAGKSVQYQLFRIDDNDTVRFNAIEKNEYYDRNLASNTTYYYQVLVSDATIKQSASNIIKVKTLPEFVADRAMDSLIAMFILSQREHNSIPDFSWHGDPIDLNILDTLSVVETDNGALKITTPNELVSLPQFNNKISEACKYTDEISIECWLKTSKYIRSETTTILSFGNDSSTAFSLNCQASPEDIEKIIYSVNLSTRTTNQQGYPSFLSEISLFPDVLNHIVFSHERSGAEKFYINGKLVAEGYRPSGFEKWNETYTLIVANDQDRQKPWLGELYMCSIYNTALDIHDVSSNYIASPFAQNNFILNSTNYQMELSPNPANNYFNLIITDQHEHLEITEKYFVRIVNQYGQISDEIIVSEYLNGELFEIGTDHLPSGFYSVNLYNQHGLIDTQKLLITR